MTNLPATETQPHVDAAPTVTENHSPVPHAAPVRKGVALSEPARDVYAEKRAARKKMMRVSHRRHIAAAHTKG
jgi:hypothetical protein